jgi:alkanesulfonate monooxygenase SsuD/methylene tetrahydromethanopterin reductase-like flavin-dependent oxidoreductase (luciferase family)
MLRTIVTAARDAGRDPSRIARIYNLPVSIGPGHAAGHPARQEVVSGPSAAVADRLVEFTRLGFSGFNFIVSGPDADAQKERLANEVMPAVGATV